MTLLEVTQHAYPIWSNAFFYVFVGSMLLFFGMLMVLLKALRKKSAELTLTQQQHVARIDVIRKEHTEKLESLRIEMLKKEEERSRQWMESEKETLHVLNGVSNLLELSDKVDKVEFKRMNKALGAIENKIISEKKLMVDIKISEKKYRQLFENGIVGIAMHEIILDEDGKPCDYRFLEVNPAFEEIIGLNASDVIGKRCSVVLPNIEPYWIEIFGKVATTGKPITFEKYNKDTDLNYRVVSYSPEPNKFIAISIAI